VEALKKHELNWCPGSARRWRGAPFLGKEIAIPGSIACSPGTENRGTSNNLMYKYGYAYMVASALGVAKNNVD
jgi:hypothetical protein